jgi:hypothetical protein
MGISWNKDAKGTSIIITEFFVNIRIDGASF